MSKVKIYVRDLLLDYSDNEDLCYYENGEDFIELYHNHQFVGYVEVFTDRENEQKEYVIINNEVVYLEDIELMNFKK